LDNENVISGGGLHLIALEIELSNLNISFNKALNGYGGGLYIQTGAVTADGLVAKYNYAKLDGGGLWWSSDILNINHSTFSKNVVGRSGGGVCLYGN
jgi:hypothetical protein